jgi:anti-sigma factor RsiW
MQDPVIPSPELINAYVDGELAPAEAAAIASLAARDADIAARIATLTKLRAVAGGLVSAAPAAGQAPPFAFPRVATARRFAALAAVLLAAAGLAAALWLVPPALPEPGLSAAIARHRSWLDGRDERGGPAVTVDLAGARSRDLPDLSIASLRLVRIDVERRRGRDGILFGGYLGPNGCRIGIWIAAAASARQTEPARMDRDGVAIRAWQHGGLRYAILGVGVDPARLDRVAALADALLRGGEASRQLAGSFAAPSEPTRPCLA